MSRRALLALLVCASLAAPTISGADAIPLIRPHPQLIQPSGGDFRIAAGTKIVVPRGWPAYVRVSAGELVAAIESAGGPRLTVVEAERPEFGKGNITIAPYEWFVRLPWIEPAPPAIVRPAPAEGHNIRIVPEYVMLAGNSPRAGFLGLQTMIQIARQATKTADGGLSLPGLYVADWPSHDWRTLQLPLGVYGSTYDRGEHRYRHITKADLLQRSVRLAAHDKLTGLVVEVGTGMHYDRMPEIYVEGFKTNEKAELRAAVDLARSLGIALVPFQNASAGHDIWLGPYPYAVPNSDLYLEALFEVFDETIEAFSPAQLHIGMDEDVATDYDEIPLRSVAAHKQVILDSYHFLLRRGVRMSVWNDGISLLQKEQVDVPRDIVVLPWYYGGSDYTPAKQYVDSGFRILCSPWSQWHVDNDQLYSIYVSSLRSDRVLGMAGTIWYPVAPDGENDYRRCLVKAAEAFWCPLQAGNYPNDKEYFAPTFADLPADAFKQALPLLIPPDELGRLIGLVTGPGGDALACETARERLVAAGTPSVAPLLAAMATQPEAISPWGEGTLRRIVREPIGDTSAMTKALEGAAASRGALRALALEMLAAAGDTAFLESQDPADAPVATALGISGDRRFLPALVKVARVDGPAQSTALLALGRLKGTDELLSLAGNWRGFGDPAREAYARALAMQASEAALPVLGELSTDANWRVRFRAAMGLGATRSAKAGPYILKLLDEKHPAVFRVALWWCTDAFIIKPEEYFPKLVSRVTRDEQPEIVRPILHAWLLMWNPGLGQWLAKGEDPARRVNYANLPVWKDPALGDAIRRTFAYSDARLAIDAVVLCIKMGLPVKSDDALAVLKGFKVEDQRWFCIRMREEAAPAAVPILRGLWDINDRLVRTFILQFCQRVHTPEVFDLAYAAYSGLPADDAFRHDAVLAMAGNISKLDETARRAVPLVLEVYDRVNPEARSALDAALCRAAGREPRTMPSNDPTDVAERLAEWKKWWAQQAK